MACLARAVGARSRFTLLRFTVAIWAPVRIPVCPLAKRYPPILRMPGYSYCTSISTCGTMSSSRSIGEGTIEPRDPSASCPRSFSQLLMLYVNTCLEPRAHGTPPPIGVQTHAPPDLVEAHFIAESYTSCSGNRQLSRNAFLQIPGFVN